jgi:hypothetical protein
LIESDFAARCRSRLFLPGRVGVRAISSNPNSVT